VNGLITLLPLIAFPVFLFGLGKWYLVKHNCVPIGVFSDYNGVEISTPRERVILSSPKTT